MASDAVVCCHQVKHDLYIAATSDLLPVPKQGLDLSEIFEKNLVVSSGFV